MKITHRYSGAPLFEGEYATTKAMLEAAVKARADLAGANLAGANLAGAYLARAYLARAYLARADLAGANLADAYLAGADLAGANLAGANLAGAYLADADLARANLARADLAGANLADAYLAGAQGIGETNGSEAKQEEPKDRAERYAARAARYREHNPEVPVVESLDAKILGVLESGAGKLNMATWHTCTTTHCRAGWAITLAGEAGKALELQHGPQRAGTMIYRASTGRVPHFFASDGRAMEDIREQAAMQVSA